MSGACVCAELPQIKLFTRDLAVEPCGLSTKGIMIFATSFEPRPSFRRGLDGVSSLRPKVEAVNWKGGNLYLDIF